MIIWAELFQTLHIHLPTCAPKWSDTFQISKSYFTCMWKWPIKCLLCECTSPSPLHSPNIAQLIKLLSTTWSVLRFVYSKKLQQVTKRIDRRESFDEVCASNKQRELLFPRFSCIRNFGQGIQWQTSWLQLKKSMVISVNTAYSWADGIYDQWELGPTHLLPRDAKRS